MPSYFEPFVAYAAGGCVGFVVLAVVVGTGGEPTVGMIVGGVVMVVVGTMFFLLRRRARTRRRSR